MALAQLPKDFSIVVSVLFNLANIRHAQGDIEQAVDLHRRVLSMLQGGLENKHLDGRRAERLRQSLCKLVSR